MDTRRNQSIKTISIHIDTTSFGKVLVDKGHIFSLSLSLRKSFSGVPGFPLALGL